jgi:hypothetical protein
VLAYALEEHIPQYRDRHGAITQNVLKACDFEMCFVYVMPSYEGTAADGMLFNVAHQNGFSLPAGCYYLAHASFANCDMLLAPYCTKRYHLKEFKHGNQWYGLIEMLCPFHAHIDHRPQDREELFNLWHAQLRNVIERVFGVKKHRFQVLTTRPEMGYHQQAPLALLAHTDHLGLQVLRVLVEA